MLRSTHAALALAALASSFSQPEEIVIRARPEPVTSQGRYHQFRNTKPAPKKRKFKGSAAAKKGKRRP